MKRVSIVEARKGLGRLADEVKRTGSSIVLTRRGRPVARIVPEPVRRAGGNALARLEGTVELRGSFSDLTKAVRELRREGALSLQRRSDRILSGRR